MEYRATSSLNKSGLGWDDNLKMITASPRVYAFHVQVKCFLICNVICKGAKFEYGSKIFPDILFDSVDC